MARAICERGEDGLQGRELRNHGERSRSRAEQRETIARIAVLTEEKVARNGGGASEQEGVEVRGGGKKNGNATMDFEMCKRYLGYECCLEATMLLGITNSHLSPFCQR